MRCDRRTGGGFKSLFGNDFGMDKKLKEELLGVLRDLMPYVNGIVVYGSFIKGYADASSDIDIYV